MGIAGITSGGWWSIENTKYECYHVPITRYPVPRTPPRTKHSVRRTVPLTVRICAGREDFSLGHYRPCVGRAMILHYKRPTKTFLAPTAARRRFAAAGGRRSSKEGVIGVPGSAKSFARPTRGRPGRGQFAERLHFCLRPQAALRTQYPSSPPRLCPPFQQRPPTRHHKSDFKCRCGACFCVSRILPPRPQSRSSGIQAFWSLRSASF